MRSLRQTEKKIDFNIHLLPEKNDVFVDSGCKEGDLQQKLDYIKTIFNDYDKEKKCIYTKPECEELQQDEFLLKYRDPISGEKTQKYKMSSIVFLSIDDSYVFNVPQNKYALIRIKNDSFLLKEGVHVIHNKVLRFHGLVNANGPYILYDNVHVLHVPPGKEAKVNLGCQSYILPARQKPYVFVTPNLYYHGMQDELGEEAEEVDEFVVLPEYCAALNSQLNLNDDYLSQMSSRPTFFQSTKKLKNRGFNNDQNNDPDKEKSGDLIKPAIKKNSMGIAVSQEISQQESQINMVKNK